MPVSKALESTTNYATRWTSERVERRLDDRDNLLSEGLYNLENRTVTLTGAATGTGVVDSSGDLSIATTLAGSSFTTLSASSDLNVDGNATFAGNMTFDGSTAQIITGPSGATFTIAAGAVDKTLAVNVPTYGNIIEILGPNMGFFRATPTGQPSSTGETSGVTAGTGTSINADATFTGGVGSTAYTISDIVRHLKNLGLLQQ
jgi:hypothetical protein